MMNARGKLIAQQKFDKLKKEEEKILKVVHDDNSGHFEIPAAAFITFENPQGKYCAERSNNMDSMKEFEILPG